MRGFVSGLGEIRCKGCADRVPGKLHFGKIVGRPPARDEARRKKDRRGPSRSAARRSGRLRAADRAKFGSAAQRRLPALAGGRPARKRENRADRDWSWQSKSSIEGFIAAIARTIPCGAQRSEHCGASARSPAEQALGARIEGFRNLTIGLLCKDDKHESIVPSKIAAFDDENEAKASRIPACPYLHRLIPNVVILILRGG